MLSTVLKFRLQMTGEHETEWNVRRVPSTQLCDSFSACVGVESSLRSLPADEWLYVWPNVSEEFEVRVYVASKQLPKIIKISRKSDKTRWFTVNHPLMRCEKLFENKKKMHRTFELFQQTYNGNIQKLLWLSLQRVSKTLKKMIMTCKTLPHQLTSDLICKSLSLRHKRSTGVRKPEKSPHNETWSQLNQRTLNADCVIAQSSIQLHGALLVGKPEIGNFASSRVASCRDRKKVRMMLSDGFFLFNNRPLSLAHSRSENVRARLF
jgi:hypothetical protein